MAGFRALAREVRNPRNTIALRRTSLRKCLERFAPYGHRATWHHLCELAGLDPADRAPDPVRLVAALTELEEARAVWLAYEASFADRRKREKHEGIRQPSAVDDWHRNTWGGCDIVPCVSPTACPAPRLADVLRRVIAAMEAGPGACCPVCSQERLEWHSDLERYPMEGPVCADCGIVVPVPVLTPGALAAARRRAFEDRYAAV
ncbi:hypothetical protein [Streptomyces sp. ISL-11]|uniref:hypothetical protein n=1 Tax=Streptomyces sp. ISL-11 TaxID=2819174 RepID=UPI001BE71BCF|nr:hypothetical protein [Streptomyces sp. ISL-11]MBT2384110.1 hypothetical protein [Streptomyces sp. ISL-11]